MLTVENPKKTDWANLSLTDVAYGCALDTAYTLKLYELFYEKLSKSGPIKLIDNVIVKAMKRFALAEWKGIPVSRGELSKQEKNLKAKLVDCEDNLFNIIKKDINYNSRQQLAEAMFVKSTDDKIEEENSILKLYPPTLTSSGDPSTDEFCLNLLLEEIEKELENRDESLEN